MVKPVSHYLISIESLLTIIRYLRELFKNKANFLRNIKAKALFSLFFIFQNSMLVNCIYTCKDDLTLIIFVMIIFIDGLSNRNI